MPAASQVSPGNERPRRAASSPAFARHACRTIGVGPTREGPGTRTRAPCRMVTPIGAAWVSESSLTAHRHDPSYRLSVHLALSGSVLLYRSGQYTSDCERGKHYSMSLYYGGPSLQSLGGFWEKTSEGLHGEAKPIPGFCRPLKCSRRPSVLEYESRKESPEAAVLHLIRMCVHSSCGWTTRLSIRMGHGTTTSRTTRSRLQV